jgi:hypothetical protein
MFSDFYPWSERHSEPEPRVREELTPRARNRLANIMTKVDGVHIQRGYEEMVDYTGREFPELKISSKTSSIRTQTELLKNQKRDIDEILDYLEYVLNMAMYDRHHKTGLGKNGRLEIIHKIERAFEDEGILVQLKPSASEVAENDFQPSTDEKLQFQQVSDETIIEADQEVRTLALGDRWKEPLAPYNKAWQMYKDGKHTSDILEKLYNSLELTTEKICADIEDWEDEEQSVGRYLQVLKEHEIFDVNPAMNEEVNHIAKSMEVTLHRMGGDRKRHIDIDADYCIFCLHQTSAMLSFIIKRYEEKYH